MKGVVTGMMKRKNKRNKEENKYNAENEIIIGVTTRPKENVRVDKKTTRTNKKDKEKILNHKKNRKINNKNLKDKRNNLKKEITKEQKIRKINSKKVVISIIFLLFIALGGTIYYLTTPVFNISNIEVYGNEKNSEETYISLSKIDIGTTNIFAITNNGIKKNIKENSYVEDVSIKRKFPNTLQIHILERKVAYQINYSNNYIYLDGQGYILEIAEDKKDFPIIKGLGIINENIQTGHRLIEEDLIKLNVVAKVINYCKYNAIENKITSIDVTDNTDYILKFEEDKKTVYLGDASNLSERLSLLKTILKNEKNKNIEIFMNGNINEDDVYIRYLDEKKGT